MHVYFTSKEYTCAKCKDAATTFLTINSRVVVLGFRRGISNIDFIPRCTLLYEIHRQQNSWGQYENFMLRCFASITLSVSRL